MRVATMPAISILFLTLTGVVHAAAPVPVPSTSDVAPSSLSAFVSLSIELASFPAYAGCPDDDMRLPCSSADLTHRVRQHLYPE
jgi:hypothetical protein